MKTNSKDLLTEKNETIRNLSLELTNRLQDPIQVKKVVTSSNNLSMIGGHPWNDVTLSAGYPATILLFTEWDRLSPNDGWDLIAHKHLLALQEGLRKHGYHNNISMFGGLSGIAFAVLSASRSGTRYTNFLSKLNDLIINNVDSLLNEVTHPNKKEVSPAWYDVIMGITGVGRYLLELRSDVKAKSALSNILRHFVQLTQSIKVHGYTVPGWYIPQKNHFTDYDKSRFPNGSFNCGLSHGIPGPLALMSIALQKGVEVEGQKEAIQRISKWLIDHAWEDEHGLLWPMMISFEEQTFQESRKLDKTRDAWCYGTAGVSRSLFLAGQSLQDNQLCEWGEKGFDAIFSRTDEQWGLDGPTFCHGYSGLLQLTMRMSQDSNKGCFVDYIKIILERLLKEYEPESPFGFRDIEGDIPVNKAGLLDGVAGIALTLLSVTAEKEQTWDYPFLIA